MKTRVLLTGATGFVGGHLYDALARAGFEVICASRNPIKAARRHKDRNWVRLDVEDSSTMDLAMANIDVIVYLVHSIGVHANYAQVESAAAHVVRDAAAQAGVRHIVYLGGVKPDGPPSAHLHSRLETGRILRSGSVATTELRAGMIVGSESESWMICSDLARLPAMVLPQWLKTRSQPVAIADVVAALTFACGQTVTHSEVFDLPGPETVTAREILERIAAARGSRPIMVDVPLLSPRVSSYWLRFVTRADYRVARELIAGLTSDLLATQPELWDRMEGFTRTPFNDAVRAAMA